jgi:hypothetical protein|nr:MAG TPA_asm: replication protein A [Bacteriophage sp.]
MKLETDTINKDIVYANKVNYRTVANDNILHLNCYDTNWIDVYVLIIGGKYNLSAIERRVVAGVLAGANVRLAELKAAIADEVKCSAITINRAIKVLCEKNVVYTNKDTIHISNVLDPRTKGHTIDTIIIDIYK